MANQSILRISKEIRDMKKNTDLSIAVACKDEDVREVRAMIIGPPDTPYEFGFFEFEIKFGREYPTKAPAVTALTTNGGQTRFNPNIYAGGKVCLSILGTWRGESGEEWSSAQGLESILISIQSLMSANPYENEPGFETAKGEFDKRQQQLYVEKIRHETLRISVIERLEEYLKIDHFQIHNDFLGAHTKDINANSGSIYEPFIDKCKRLFNWYYDTYLSTIEKEGALHKDRTRFEKMSFEGPRNSMDGSYSYTVLRRRLLNIREKLDEEVEQWVAIGARAVVEEKTLAVNLQLQFDQTVSRPEICEGMMVDVELVDKNPFLWQVILYGRPLTNLDGGIFRIKIYISPNFPEELPRVKVETPIFHHRVSKGGHLYYALPDNVEDIRRHIEQIVSSIEDENPAYDPRTLVNPEASKLLWGSAEEKKAYTRKLRRSAQESADYL